MKGSLEGVGRGSPELGPYAESWPGCVSACCPGLDILEVGET